MREKKRVISLLIIVSMFIIMFAPMGYDMKTSAAETGTMTGSYVYLRETPGGNEMKDAGGNTIYLMIGQQVNILDTTNSSWYKVSLTYNGAEYTGYTSSQYVSINSATPPTYDPGANASFEEKLTAQGFPESYKVLLRNLHIMYPNWEFKAVHTGLDWSAVVAGEVNTATSKKNLVQGTASLPRYSWRSTTVGYDIKNDKWTPFDGSNWFAASDELVAYYLDPRSYLYDGYIFVFESLSYVEGVQNAEGVEAILAGSFMSNTVVPGDTRTYAQVIVEAGKASGVSPYHIASRIRQEVGSSGNSCTNGQNSSVPGIYNFYNIGAYDGTDAATAGLKWAATPGSYGRPWDTPAKSIMGGAEFLGASYIKVAQDTLYTQKFNVTNTSCLFSHQYMTNIQAPSSESIICHTAYKNNNLLSLPMEFKIPVYNNMPETAVSKPIDGGNPNNWLKQLSIAGYVLSPAFDVNMTTDYSLTVPETTESINITGATVNSKAKVSGLGTISLLPGVNDLVVSVTAQNGKVRNYNLRVIRGDASLGNNQLGTTVADLNGDNTINYKDIVKLQRIIMGLDQKTEQAMQIGDINKDGVINYKDIVKVQRHIMGLEIIQVQ